MNFMDCIRYICCIKSRDRYESIDEQDNDIVRKKIST